jgi:hypothetical protein
MAAFQVFGRQIRAWPSILTALHIQSYLFAVIASRRSPWCNLCLVLLLRREIYKNITFSGNCTGAVHFDRYESWWRFFWVESLCGLVRKKPTFRRSLLYPSSGLKWRTQQASTNQSARRLNPKEHLNRHRRESFKSHGKKADVFTRIMRQLSPRKGVDIPSIQAFSFLESVRFLVISFFR